MTANAPPVHDTPFGAAPRPLTEAVLQSAEEAVVANPDSVETLQRGELVSDTDPVTQRVSRRERISHVVAEKPLQSALAALAAGALLAALVKSTLRRRRDRTPF